MKTLLSFILAALFLHTPLDAMVRNRKEREPKLLVLIISSDQFPLYTELQENWRAYMNYDPEHVKVYFIKGDPNLACQYKIEGDTIWSRVDEGWPPESSGIIDKTIYSMEAMLPRSTNSITYYEPIYPRFTIFQTC